MDGHFARDNPIHRIEDLLENRFKAFENLLSSKLDSTNDNDVTDEVTDEKQNRPYPIEHIDLRKHWIRPKPTKPPRPDHLPKSDCPKLDEPVDAVYTWVNGSDPDFKSSLEGTKFEMKAPSKEDMHNQRFEGMLKIFNPLFFRRPSNFKQKDHVVKVFAYIIFGFMSDRVDSCKLFIQNS